MCSWGKKSTFYGWVAGGLLGIFGKIPKGGGVEELKKADFKVSMPGIGVRFTEKIRGVFRFKWLKKH